MDRVLSSCKVGKGSTLYAQWPQNNEKEERRKRYGKAWDTRSLERRTKDERKLRRESRAAKTEGLARKRNSEVLEYTTQCTPETGGDEKTSSPCVLDDRPGEETEVDAEGEYTDAGARDLSGEVVHEEQDDQQAEEQGHEERVTGEVEQDDPFADEDADKENRDPMNQAPGVETRANDDPAEELFVFDESYSGLRFDLMEEVLEF